VTLVGASPVVDALTAEVVDYAGLFPPAALDMATAVRRYAAYLASDERALLGRFVVPVARLEEFEHELEAATRALHTEPRTDIGARTWRLAALAGDDPLADSRRIAAFNAAQRAVRGGHALIDTVETRAARTDDVVTAAALAHGGQVVFVEVPSTGELDPLLPAVARYGLGAKVRTGGVTPDAIPPAASVARFLVAASCAHVPCKATAGLHHAFRGRYPLTYATDSPQAIMHGFVNVLLAAALVHGGGQEREAVMLLDEMDPSAFEFDATEVRWRQHRIAAAQLRVARAEFIRSFGSCSFDEPVETLRARQLL